MSDKIYVGDIGTIVTVDCGEDISTATVNQLMVQKPDGTIVTWEAAVYNTNYLRYTIMDGDLDQAGVYKVQSKITLPSWSGLGETDEFTVNEAYE
jgi:hypothetical protein